MFLFGCFSLESAKSPGQTRHMVVRNYGWFLFHYIPLATGNASENPWIPWAFFRNDVTLDKIQGRFMKHAEEMHMEPKDLMWSIDADVLFDVPGTSFPMPIPYVLTYREMQLSGVLK